MGSKRRRRLPVTSETSDNARASTRSRSSSLKGSPKAQTTRGLIRRFHVLLKQRSKLLENQEESKVYSTKERNQSKTNETQATDLKNQRLEHIDAEISEMGGLEVYQMMSAAGQLGERGGGSEKVLIGWMKELDLHNRPTPPFRKGKEEKMGNHVPPKMRQVTSCYFYRRG
ncbi:hypothetical protein FRC02_011997 [Tulasnella sp. 418]|nr:hypothetical protein FRC02_011997 [Tulasnella sp. 418]